MPSLRIYVAAPFGERAVAASVASRLASAGHHITSTWHATTRTTEVTDPGERRAVLRDNLADLQRAQVMVACTAVGTPRATYGEIGRFLEKGRPVVWLQGADGQGGNIDDADPLVTIVRDEGRLIAAVAKLAGDLA